MQEKSKDSLQSQLIQNEAEIDWLKFQVKIMRGFLIGFLFFAIRWMVQSTKAAAVPIVSPFHPPPLIGVFVDVLTGVPFELYDHRVHSTLPPLENYYANLARDNNLTDSNILLDKRGWLNCRGLGNDIKTACCHTAHGLGTAVRDLGVGALTAVLQDQIVKAFSNGRGNQRPRSICHTYDGDNICTSWANYDSNILQNGESGDMARFAADCAQKGHSTEFRGTDSVGGTIYVCISDRATGCEASVG